MNITKVYHRFRESEHMFMCPLCNNQMKFENENSLRCQKKHCFDLSKYGYVNFAPNQKKAKYTKRLFENRRFIFQAGFYDPLIEIIEGLINKHLGAGLSQTYVLDAGCGEGFFSSRLFNDGKEAWKVFAMDILKEAIILADKGNGNIKWLVGDLANIPLKSNTIGLLLNIFAPANYSEFSRILNDDGLLIKVIPGKSYLKELRNYAEGQLHSQDYSNEQVFQCFNKNMIFLETSKLFYQRPVSKEHLKSFIEMTPMMFDIDINRMEIPDIQKITIDIEVAVGKKKAKNHIDFCN